MNMYDLKDTFTEEANIGTVQRVISGASGAALLTMGFRDLAHPTAKTWMQLATGAFLLFRGVTSYCPIMGLYEKEYPKEPGN